MNKIIAISLGIPVFLGLVGCRSNSNDKTNAVANVVKANGNPVIQDGDYSSGCDSSTLPNIGDIKFVGVKTVYHLSSLDFSRKKQFYSDAECKELALTVDEKGQLNVRGKSATIPQALDEDFHFTNTSVTLNNDTLIKAFNALEICGKKEWAKDRMVEVTAESAQKTCPGKTTPRTVYEVAAVENGNLYLGADATKETEADRPKQLDQSKPYKKVQ